MRGILETRRSYAPVSRGLSMRRVFAARRAVLRCATDPKQPFCQPGKSGIFPTLFSTGCGKVLWKMKNGPGFRALRGFFGRMGAFFLWKTRFVTGSRSEKITETR